MKESPNPPKPKTPRAVTLWRHACPDHSRGQALAPANPLSPNGNSGSRPSLRNLRRKAGLAFPPERRTHPAIRPPSGSTKHGASTRALTVPPSIGFAHKTDSPSRDNPFVKNPSAMNPPTAGDRAADETQPSPFPFSAPPECKSDPARISSCGFSARSPTRTGRDSSSKNARFRKAAPMNPPAFFAIRSSRKSRKVVRPSNSGPAG